MFSFQSKPSLKEVIINLLAKRTEVKGVEIRQTINKLLDHDYTKQAIYKELRNLEAQGIIVKENSAYSLKLSWVISITELSEQLEETYFSEENLKKFLPTPNKSTKWMFSTLEKTDIFWTQLLLNIFKLNPKSISYVWCPHPWFYLIHPDVEKKLLSSFEKIKAQVFHLFGGDNYLDKLYIKLKQTIIKIPTKISKAFIPKYENTYLDIVGDYIITIKPDTYLSNKIETYFKEVKNKGDLHINPPNVLIHTKGKIQFTVENNPKKAEKLKNQYLKIFNSTPSYGNLIR